jgi:hypothetical protein
MKAPCTLRRLVVILTACGALLFWSPFLLAIHRYDVIVGHYFPNIGWWLLYGGEACLLAVLPLSIVSLMRRDYLIGAFGLAVVFLTYYFISGLDL